MNLRIHCASVSSRLCVTFFPPCIHSVLCDNQITFLNSHFARRIPLMNVRIFLAASALVALTGWATAESWDRFRGPDGSGVARNQNLPLEFDEAKNLVWKTVIPGLGNSS